MKDHKEKFLHNCNCDHPEIRDSFMDGKCSEKQIIECHGHEILDKLKKEGI
jgi:hypothetical protein